VRGLHNELLIKKAKDFAVSKIQTH
jgi:hypothetical protein